MPVPVQNPEISHTANGVSTVFAYPFLIFAAADLRVRVDGTLAVLNVDYTVTGVDVETGGTVVFSIAPSNGASVVIKRSIPLGRSIEYQYSGDFQSPTVNEDFDRLWMMGQDINTNSERALRLPVGDTSSTDLPPLAERALRGMAFDASGNPVAAPASDATSLGVMLADSVTDNNGAALVGFDQTNNYPAGTVGKALSDASGFAVDLAGDDGAAKVGFDSGTGYPAGTVGKSLNDLNTFGGDLVSQVDSAKGSSFVGYLPPWAGATGRSLSSRLQEMVSATDFGLRTQNTGAQNVVAINAAIAYAIAQGGLTLHIPRGTYDFNGTITLTNAHNLRITGDGIDATVLRITSATADFFNSTGDAWYQTIDNLTLTSSVTRTAGAMFRTQGLWKRGLMDRVKITRFFNGVVLEAFEQSTLSDVYAVNPSGAGTTFVAGKNGAGNYGANLLILNCFLRGNDDSNPASAPVGLVGLSILDVQAIFAFNTDIGQYINQCMLVAPQTSTFNNYFNQVFFDGTKNGDNVFFTGAGTKDRFQFTGCWFNGAGALPGGSVDVAGVSFTNSGTYSDFLFSGCRFVSQQGASVYIRTPVADMNFTGCTFNNAAAASAIYKAPVFCDPATTQTKGAIFNGCLFIASGNATADFYFGTNSRGNVISGSRLDKGVLYQSGASWGKCAGNSDTTSYTIPAADLPLLSPTKDYFNVTGAGSIGTIPQTFPGHRVTLVMDNVVTFFDSSSLHLAGNFVTANGSVLNLICEPAGGGWREMSRVNT